MAKSIFGILYIDSIKLSCSFMVEDFVVTLIPEQDQNKIYELRKWAEQREEMDGIEWLSGVTSDNKLIHIARRLRGGYRSGSGIDIGAINFFSPIIIEHKDSLPRGNNGFYGIEFIGGDVNLVYPPDKAINYTKEPYGIEYKDPQSYTDIYNIELNKEKFRLIKTIDAHYVRARGQIVNLSKNIKSKIRIEFDKEKPFDELLTFYGYVRNLITFLTRISNNEFEVKLLTKTSFEEKQYYEDFAIVKLSNIDRSFIKYTQIVDICSAIEIEYKLRGQLEENNELKKKSRDLAKQINAFVEEVGTDDLLKEKAKNIIGAGLKNYSPSLREKIKLLYNSHKDGLELIIKDHTWIPNFSDEIFYKKIKQFIEMRNRTAHQKMSWNGGEAIYTHIMILIYLSIFERANISRDIAISSINRGFRNIF